MSSTPANPPPYSEKHLSTETSTLSASTAASRIAGTAQTCSIRDFQVDYLTIVRDSPTSYHIALTVDPTPIYHVKLAADSTKLGDIQIVPASDPTLPAVAAARLASNPKSKTEPPATICTSAPHLPDAHWRPLTRATGLFSVDAYQTSIPIVTVPGRAPAPHQFSWRTGLSQPFYQLLWDGPLPLVPSAMFMQDQRGSEYVFATVARKTAKGGENLIEMRRGGGLDFELSVVLELFVLLHFKQEQLL